MHFIDDFGSHSQLSSSSTRLVSVAALLAAVMAVGCGADAGTEAPGADVATSEQALHSSNASTPWWGASPSGLLQTSNVGALQVVYSVSVGVTNSAITGLSVCWYAPSNADNIYRQGDQFACSIVGKTTATAWSTLTCPTNKVLSGYDVRRNNAGNKIIEFTPFCRSLTNPSQAPTPLNTVIALGEVAELFTHREDCSQRTAANAPAFIEHFISNNNFSGFQAACVLP